MADPVTDPRRHRFYLLALLFLALLVRCFPAGSLLGPDFPLLAGGPDSYYHLRRTALALAGTLAPADRWINFPFGLASHWPPLYDSFLGAVYGLAGLTGVLFVPVGFGLLALVAAGSAFRTRYGALAIPGLWLLATIPAAAFPTCLGALDHHAAELLTIALAIAGLAAGGWRGGALAALAVTMAVGSTPTWPVVLLAALAAVGLQRGSGRVAGLALAAALLALPLAGRGYLTMPWLDGVAECRPLLASGQDLLRALVACSPGLLLIPVAAPLWWRERRSPLPAALLATAAVALPLALAQSRFAVYLALPAVAALLELYRRARDRFRADRVFAGLLTALFGLMLALGLRGTVEMLAWEPDPPPAITGALRYLRDCAPPPGDWLQPESPPAYGVLARWDYGHALVTLARRPAVATPFHGGTAGRALADQVLAAAPGPATDLADRHRIRYLLLTADLAALPAPDAVTPNLFQTLFAATGPVPGWRRVYASPETAGVGIPAAQVWERTAAR